MPDDRDNPAVPSRPCPGDCGKEVAWTLFVCFECFDALPTKLQEKLQRAVAPAEVEKARGEAIVWYNKNKNDRKTSGGRK